MTEAANRIEELYELKGSITGLSTGFKDLDKKTSGLQKSDLIIVAGRPQWVKLFAMNLVEHAAMNSDKAILVFSLEMPASSLIMRMFSSIGKINASKVRNGQLEDSDWPNSAAMKKKETPLFIDDASSLTPTELRARARRVSREQGGLGMIMIDYLQLMQVAGG